jgi:hypothetical protein
MQCSIDDEPVRLKLMSTVSNPREQLRALGDELPDDLLPDAIAALTHLEDDEPLSAQEVEDMEAALDDIEHGRMISLKDYERQRGL